MNERRIVDRLAFAALGTFAILVLWVALFQHLVPLYSSETDLVGDYIPAARALESGQLHPGSYASKGIGYPLLLAASAPLLHGDAFLAARLLNCAAAVAAAWACFATFSRLLGALPGLFVLFGLLASPTFLRYAVEAGTDMPAMALAFVATYLIVWRISARSAAIAGFLAGYAIIMRYNYIFLPVAGIIILAASPLRRRSLVPYLAGCIIPVGTWLLINFSMTGSPFTNTNYLNLAYALYGNGVDWEHFVTRIGPNFHSLSEVLRFNPPHVLSRLASNLATYWWEDVRGLLPLWVGVVAPVGLLWLGFRERRPRGTAIHFGLAYLILCFVFRAPRFALYLIPYYTAGVVALTFCGWPGSRGNEHAVRRADWFRIAPVVCLLFLFGFSGVQAVGGIRAALAQAPDETRRGGLLLGTLGRAGATVMARKPHVAYFADMRFAPIPAANTLVELISAGRATKAEFLFISPIEIRLRPAFAVLADSALNLPGLRQIGHSSAGVTSWFSLYAFMDSSRSLGSLQADLIDSLVSHAAARPSAEHEMAATSELIGARRYREALDHLAIAEMLRPQDPDVAALQSNAHHALGEYEEAARACERAMRLGPASPMYYSQLGRIRYMQQRYAEASNSFRQALALDPGNTGDVFLLGLSLSRMGEYSAAAEAFEQFLATEPNSARAVRLAAGNRILAGDETRALRVIDNARRRGVEVGEDLNALADSLRSVRSR